jgi:hypothetical protein
MSQKATSSAGMIALTSKNYCFSVNEERVSILVSCQQ